MYRACADPEMAATTRVSTFPRTFFWKALEMASALW